MLWIKMAARLSKQDADVFEDSDDENNYTFSLEDRTWEKLEVQRHKDGYRDGVDIGEDASLQAGHDAGFCETSLIFHLAKMRGSVMAMRSCLSLSVVDDNAAASLKLAMDCLEDKTRQLEQQWIDSVLTSPAAHNSQHHQQGLQNDACQRSANCDNGEVTAADSDCRPTHDNITHINESQPPIDKTTHTDESQLVDANLSVFNRTIKVDESGLVDTDQSLCSRTWDSDSQNHMTAETVNSTCQQFVEQHRPIETTQSAGTDDCGRLSANCTAAMETCETVDQFVLEPVNDLQYLAQYKSCCSQLQQLMDHFQSVTRM